LTYILTLTMWVYHYSTFFAKVRFRRLRSSKDIDFGMNRKYVCDVLSIRLCPTLHRFRDIAGFFAHGSTPIPP